MTVISVAPAALAKAATQLVDATILSVLGAGATVASLLAAVVAVTAGAAAGVPPQATKILSIILKMMLVAIVRIVVL